MTDHEEARSWSVFQSEFAATRDPRASLRAALIDFESRVEDERRRLGSTPPERPWLESNRQLAERLCARAGADLERAFSGGWASKREAAVRGVVVCLLTDQGMTAGEIARVTGIGMATVQNCRAVRGKHPEWQAIIAEGAA